MKKNKIIGILLLSLIIICGCNCKDNDENNNPNPNTNKLLGTWVTENYRAYNDTIIFTNDYYIKKYFIDNYTGDDYIIKYRVSNDTIYFTDAVNLTLSCTFVLQNDSLIIHKFSYIFSNRAVIHEDITFTKVN